MIKKMIQTVTVTGADDSIKPEELVLVARDFRFFVEFGILLSKDRFGTARFPSQKWIDELYELSREHKFALSGHICGEWIGDLCVGKPTFFDDFGYTWNMFDRIQLNFHGIPYALNFGEMGKVLKRYLHSKKIIFQIDGVNDTIFEHMDGRCDFSAFPFFDMSHGAGVVPNSWPAQPRMKYCGYAGGLCADNLLEELKKISQVADGPIWIDAETKLRSNNGMFFDLQLVRRFLKTAEPFVTG